MNPSRPDARRLDAAQRYQREVQAHDPERPGASWVCPLCGAFRPPSAYFCPHTSPARDAAEGTA